MFESGANSTDSIHDFDTTDFFQMNIGMNEVLNGMKHEWTKWLNKA